MFSLVLRPSITLEQVRKFVNALELFKIGYSWGGVTSLVVAYNFSHYKGRPDYQHRIVRLNIGLEATEDLIADLENALKLLASG